MIRFTRQVLPHMRARGGGRIVNINAVLGRSPDPKLFATSVNRAACISLSKALAIELGSRAGRRLPAPRLTVTASHDLVLAALRDALPAAAGLSLDLAFMGSLHALEQFAEGRTDLAGFHVPFGVHAAGELAPFRRLLRARRDRLIRVVDRDQGFMLPRGNPSRVHGFRDLVRKRLRFVNRQRGSGTRLLIDRLIADEGLEASSLVGYANEEFTHPAVAATVASRKVEASRRLHQTQFSVPKSSISGRCFSSASLRALL